MKIINLVPGSAEWLARRTASQASIIMGKSPHCSRAALLRMKAAGLTKEVSEWAQENLLDRGHEIEFAAREAASEFLGDDLYPVCGESDDGYLTASFDGISVGWDTVWECKSWNMVKAADVRTGKAPECDYWQLVHQAIVADVDSVWYEVTDGN